MNNRLTLNTNVGRRHNYNLLNLHSDNFTDWIEIYFITYHKTQLS